MALQPGDLRAHYELAAAHFRANLLLGRILALQADAASVTYLRTAVDVQPDSTEARQFLAEASRIMK